MNSELQTILIFEPLSGGHRANFIRWLTAATSEYTGCRFVFFTADDVDELTARRLATAGRWKKQHVLYQLFRQACRKYKPDQALVLELTHLELPLALFGSPVPLSAILFVQYPELSNGWKKISKHWKTRLLLWRSPVQNLFLLNGEKSCQWLSKRFGSRTRFIPLSDPAPAVPPVPDFSFYAQGKRVGLFFGAISRRKGADVLLEVLARIRPETARTHVFFFCGKPESDYSAAFEESVRALRAARPDVDVRVDRRFVPEAEAAAMFEQADLILMPYVRPEYSSGILAQAAQAGTPVLGPAGGLIGRLIRENGLGLAADLTPDMFELPIELNEVLRRRFVMRNTVENFTKPILDAVCHEG